MRLTKRLLRKLIKEEMENAENSISFENLPEFQGPAFLVTPPGETTKVRALQFRRMVEDPVEGPSDPDSKEARFKFRSPLITAIVPLSALPDATKTQYIKTRKSIGEENLGFKATILLNIILNGPAVDPIFENDEIDLIGDQTASFRSTLSEISEEYKKSLKK